MKDNLILIVIRLIVFSPLILLIACHIPLMWLLGVDKPTSIVDTFNESIVANIKDK